MRYWLTIFALMFGFTVWGQAQVQPPLVIQWLSFVLDNNNQPVPIRLNPTTGLPDLTNGVPVDSRFPSVSADGRQVIFQVGSGQLAQLWQANWDVTNNLWQVNFIPVPQSAPPQPLLGIKPINSVDGNHIAFASWQDYRPQTASQPTFPDPPRAQIYILDRTQNRIVPVSFLWIDTDGDDLRDAYEPSNGNCVPVHISSDGRIVVFLALSPDALNIIDEDGDGNLDSVPNPPEGWIVLIHDRDADGNGIYDEAGIGATRTFIGSYDWDIANNQPIIVPTASVTVSANGRIIAFTTPMPFDPNNPNDPNRERWTVVVRDWQNQLPNPQSPTEIGIIQRIDDAFAATISDDGICVAFLAPVQMDNDGDGQANEDPIDNNDNDGDGLIDEDPYDPYPQTHMDLVVRQLVDPITGQPPAQARELRLTGLQLLSQAGAADGISGWGYSDWWGAVTVAVEPTDPNIAYVAFHAWATDLIDFQIVRNDLFVDPNNQTNRLRFYQGIPNIFLVRFDFNNFDNNPQAPNRMRLWRLTEWTDQQQPTKLRGLPVSLEQSQQGYRLTLAPSLIPVVSFVNGRQLHIVFQSLAPFDQADTNALWDVYLATVTLP